MTFFIGFCAGSIVVYLLHSYLEKSSLAFLKEVVVLMENRQYLMARHMLRRWTGYLEKGKLDDAEEEQDS